MILYSKVPIDMMPYSKVPIDMYWFNYLKYFIGVVNVFMQRPFVTDKL
jgi:hypothetical protein